MTDQRAKPRVLVLTSTFPRWRGDATPRFVADLSEGLARDGLDVTLLAPGSRGAAAHERWGDVDVRRFQYGWPASTQRLADGAILPNIRAQRLLALQAPPFVLAQLVAAWRLMRGQRFDVIHAHWTVPQGLIAATLKRTSHVPVITTTHGADLFALRSAPMIAAKRWALASSDAVTTVSRALKEQAVALGADESRVHVLPMGVDTERFTPEAASPQLRRELNPDGPLLLFVGRLAEKKGARYAIEAMPLILREQPGARLVLIGDGPERDRLLSLRDRLGLGDAVRFLGPVANETLPAYYATADVFIGPSVVASDGDTESFGVVFVEAMASGCPVVATDVGGIADVVTQGSASVLVPQRDPQAIAAGACEMLGSRERHPDLAEQARQRTIDRFDQRALHKRYAALAKSVARAA